MAIQDQTFCIYCQKDYKTPWKLRNHILKMHEGTYAYYAILAAPERKAEQ